MCPLQATSLLLSLQYNSTLKDSPISRAKPHEKVKIHVKLHSLKCNILCIIIYKIIYHVHLRLSLKSNYDPFISILSNSDHRLNYLSHA